jgi:phosphoglycerate dehydrogenase-like enzyme
MHTLVLSVRDPRPLWAPPDWLAQEIERALPNDWQLRTVDAAADGRGDGSGVSREALEAVREAEVYVGFGFPRELLLEAMSAGRPPTLRWIHSAAAGVGSLLYPEMKASDVLITNSAAIHAPPMAETVIAMILYFARGLDFAVQAQAQKRWDDNRFFAGDTPVREIAGATLGIIGYGGIGRETARRARAFGMRVIATRRSGRPTDDGTEIVTGANALAELLSASDYVLISAPATKETHHLLGAAELCYVKPSAVIVNVARGSLIDEDALIASLRENRIRGAALDVFTHEPLPAESPLWNLENVLITPHTSATSHDFWRREADLILHNLQAYVSHRPLRNVVDKNAGY